MRFLTISVKTIVLATCLLAAAQRSNCSTDTKVVLTPDMVLNESALGSAAGLVDEQSAVGDPASGKASTPTHPFFPGWTAWQYPIHVMIDLKVPRHITRIFLYNDTGTHKMVVSTGTPFQWKDQSFTLGGFRSWQEEAINADTRYLRLTLLEPTSLPELVIYAEGPPPPIPPVIPAPESLNHQNPPMEELIGANAFIDDPVEAMGQVLGYEREYHDWGWDVEAPDHRPRYQPSGAAGGNLWFFDTYYGQLKARGVYVVPCIEQSVLSYFKITDPDAKPVPPGANAEDPKSYLLHGQHMFQLAARYGGRKVADNLLDLGPGQPRISGAGLLRALENTNEPDKTWRGRAGWFSPYELAAMCSADYDGDLGAMGKTVGVKNADSTMKLVLGGLAGLNLEYLRTMKLWADFHRNGDFPADVINLHHYSSDGNEQGFKTRGISPEDDHLQEKIGEVVNWCHLNIPGREVWLTEFGYDTDPRSPLHSPAIGKMTAQQVQAAWLVRSYLALAAAGVDRAAMFMFRDTNSSGSGVFETCGLVTQKGEWKPKPSFFYIGTLKKRLTGFRFVNEVPSGEEHVRIYRFQSVNSNQNAYAVWCTTSEDRRLDGYNLHIDGAGPAATVEFADGKLNGVEASVKVVAGSCLVNISETPILVFPTP